MEQIADLHAMVFAPRLPASGGGWGKAVVAILLVVALLALPFALIAALILAARWEARRHPWQFRISDVVSQAFSTIGRAPLPLLGTALLLYALPSTGIQLAIGFDPRGSLLEMPGERLVAMMVAWGVVALVLGTLGELAMVALSLDLLAGRPARLTAAFGQAARLLLPGIVVRLLWWLGVSFGVLLMLIPGLVLLLTWAVVLPVLVAERPGIFGSFARSVALVRGARWRLLLLAAIVIVVWAVVGGMGQGFLLASTTSAARTGSLVLQTAVTTVSGALTATGLSAIYHQLKSQREGLVGEDLEAVFA